MTDTNVDELDARLAEILCDAYGDDEQLWAFHSVFDDRIELPVDAFVIDEPVSILAFDYDGNPRRGLVAHCRREDRSRHTIFVNDIAVAPNSDGALYIATYRYWSGSIRQTIMACV